MFIDAREVARDSTIETGICVIGAGAAGITLALALRGAGFPVAVLESGGFDYDDATQDLPLDRAQRRRQRMRAMRTCKQHDFLDFVLMTRSKRECCHRTVGGPNKCGDATNAKCID